jgi:hypothetical protein
LLQNVQRLVTGAALFNNCKTKLPFFCSLIPFFWVAQLETRAHMSWAVDDRSDGPSGVRAVVGYIEPSFITKQGKP